MIDMTTGSGPGWLKPEVVKVTMTLLGVSDGDWQRFLYGVHVNDITYFSASSESARTNNKGACDTFRGLNDFGTVHN